MNQRALPASERATDSPLALLSQGPGGRLARGLFLALGLAVFLGLSWRIGVGEILSHLAPLGWSFVLVFPSYLLVFALDAAGWRFAFDRPIPVGLPSLTALQIAGKAANLLTPLAPIGGEPLKAYLLRLRGIPFGEGLASVVISKTLTMVAHGLFVVIVTVVAVIHLGLPVPFLRAVLGAVAIGALLVGAFVLAQVHGLFGRAVGLLGRVGLGLPAIEEDARQLDRRILGYYRREPRRLLTALSFHLSSWFAEGIEVYVLLWLLGLRPSPEVALAVTAFSSVVRAASFPVPASLGIQEGGNVVVFMSFGLPPDVAMAFSLLRRLREAVWAGAGFLLLSRSDLNTRLSLAWASAGGHEPEVAA